MPLVRKFAIQGHAVPNGYTTPRGPFPPEVLRQGKVTYTEEYTEPLPESFDNMRVFRCRDCNEFLFQDDLADHLCEG
jgi:hypothetical protein